MLVGYPLHLALACYCTGLALSIGADSRHLTVAIAAGVLLACAVVKRLCVGLILCGLVIGGGVVGAARLSANDRSVLRSYAGEQLVARGWLLTHPRRGSYWRSARVEVEQAKFEQVGDSRPEEKVLLRASSRLHWPSARIGDELLVRGSVELPKTSIDSPSQGVGNRAAFDWPAFLRRQGIAVELKAESVRKTGMRRSGPLELVDDLRNRADKALSVGLQPAQAALLEGMVLGADENIPKATVDDFRRSGLAHLLAVSGQNIVLLTLLASAIFGQLGLARSARLAFSLVLIAIYVPLTGAGPPILRAGVMGAAGIVAGLVGRATTRWYALLLAVAVTLTVSPLALLDVGWQLSFAAVVGIFWLTPKIRPMFRRLPTSIAEGSSITMAATLLTMPLMAHHFDRVSLVSVVANLVVLPVVAPIMWLGMLSAAIGQVWLVPAELLNRLNSLCLGFLAQVGHWSAQQSFAVTDLPLPRWWQVVAAYVLLGIAVLALQRLVEAWSGIKSGAGRRYLLVALMGLVVLGASAITSTRQHLRPKQFAVSFLDVGQGDSTLLQTPAGHTVLIDAGPPEVDLAALLSDAGVEHIDLLVLTHDQLDHYGGLKEALDRYKISTVINGGFGSQNLGYRALIQLLRRQRARILNPVEGQVIRLDHLVLRVLHVRGRASEADRSEDPNRRAVVIAASYGEFDVFLPADAESEAWGQLDLPDVEVLKVAHHGSADEGLTQALTRLRPEVAVVSAGLNNRFGHPHPTTVAALRRAGAALLRTDREGTIRIGFDAGEIRISNDRRDR